MHNRGFVRGSSLLVTLLVMGILLTLTLGLSTLVIREIRQTGDIVSAGKAYYAAEAGIEQGLYELADHYPGYETTDNDNNVPGWKEVDMFEGNDSLTDKCSYRYKISNKGNTIPYIPDDEPIYLQPSGVAVSKGDLFESHEDQTYNVLPLNQSVTIPLFIDDGNGGITDVDDFLLQYYVDFSLDDTLLGELNPNYKGRHHLELEDFDILRWKVFGNRCPSEGDCDNPDLTRTDAISDFFPSSSLANEHEPVCIGTDLSLAVGDYNCMSPVDLEILKIVRDDSGEIKREDDGSYASNIEMLDNLWSASRTCYMNEVGQNVTGGADIKNNCTIGSFMKNHTRNFLTITNVVNPEIIGISNVELRNSRANIYWRVIAKGSSVETNVIPRQFADIKADGYANDGKVQQSIDVKVGMSSFLPVFNFTLYGTSQGSANEDLDSPGGGLVDETSPLRRTSF